MSNPIKGIGKVFKKAVKVVKKVALPLLAVGAVVLTGGAALGALPALGGAGGLLASAGISGPLAGVLTSAANAATFGALGAAVTGKNIVKGATAGFLTGGVMGGLGVGLGGPASGVKSAATTAASTAGNAATEVAQTATTALPEVAANASFNEAFAPLAQQTGAGGLGVGSAALPVSTAASSIPSGATQAAKQGGILGFINNNPTLVGMGLQGLGAGLSARAQAKDAARERASYDGIGDYLFKLSDSGDGAALPDAGGYYQERVFGKMAWDPKLGRIVSAG